MDKFKFVPALQLQDQSLIQKALAHLSAECIPADSILVSECPAESFPKWAKPAAGGWFLRIEEAAILRGMKALEPIMGYSPD